MRLCHSSVLLTVTLFFGFITGISWGDDYTGRVAVVTGGSSGIGFHVAEEFVRRGASVVLVARDQSKLATAREVLVSVRKNENQRIETFLADVGRSDEVDALAAWVETEFHGVDYLVNSAGYCYPQFLEVLPAAEVEGMIRTNLLGTINMVRYFQPLLINRPKPAIINIASMASYFHFAGMTVYVATKAGVLAFSKALANELVMTPIRVSVVLPPDTDTPGLHRENLVKPPVTFKLSGTAKLMQPQEVAKAILKGVERGQFEIVPGLGNRFLVFVGKSLPDCVRWLFNYQARHILK